MKEAVLPFFEWADQTALAEGMKQSLWLFPVVEAFHLVAFALLGGCILLVDMRLAGLVLKRRSASELSRAVMPWLLGALALMFVSGGLLFVSETMKLYHNDPFWAKMRFLVLGLIFTFTVRRKVISMDPEHVGHWAKAVALVNVVLWSGVAWGGRWIGFW